MPNYQFLFLIFRERLQESKGTGGLLPLCFVWLKIVYTFFEPQNIEQEISNVE
jgi:hypothetical protein